jgi:hypothetical protein
VSDASIAGGRYVDTAETPRLGYIGAKPDLVLEHLESVSFETSKFFTPPQPIVNITMRKESITSFASLTGRASGNRVLIMFGDVALTAPRVAERIEDGKIYIVGGPKLDLKKIASDLQGLVP